MKKFLICFIISFMAPLNALAETTITSATINGPSEATIGQSFSVTFGLNFDGLDKTSMDTFGIYDLAIILETDDDILIPENFSSASSMYTTMGRVENTNAFAIFAERQDNMKNQCADSYLYCGNYQVTIKFYVKETDKESITIKYDKIGVDIAPVSATEINDSNTKDIYFDSSTSYTVKLNKNDSSIGTPPKDITQDIPETSIDDPLDNTTSQPVNKPPVTTTKPKTTKITPTTTTSTSIPTSKNILIKSLEIKNQEFVFDQTKDYFELFIEDNTINFLELNLELENPNSTYTIVGADDLAKNDNKVKISVTSENGQKHIYTINVKFKNQKYGDKPQEEIINLFGQTIKKKYVTYCCIGFGVIIALVVLVVVGKIVKDRVENRKYYKALKNLDDKE